MNRLGDRLRTGLNQVLTTRGIKGCAYGVASLVRIFVGADAQELGLPDWTLDEARLDRGMGALSAPLHLAMLLQGVDYNRGSGIAWLNGAMTDADIDFMVDAFARSLERVAKDGLLP